MPRLSHWELESFSASLATLYSAADMESLPGRVTRCLDQLFDCEVSSFDLLDISRTRCWNLVVTWPVMPHLAELTELLQQFAHQHPLILHARKFSYSHAFRTSDVLSLRQYRHLGVYHDFYRTHVMGVDRQMAFIDVTATNLTFGVSLNRRGRDFSDGQRSQLELLRTHLRQAYAIAQTHRQVREDAAASLCGGVCQVDAEGIVHWATDEAERLLARYFPVGKTGAKGLPPPLLAMVRAALTTPAKKGEVSLTRTPAWEFPSEFGTLTVQLSARLAAGQWQLLLSEKVPEPSAESLASRYGLTRRQAQTLYWLGQAKTNGEIGIILGLSTETIKEYVAHVLAKLAVPNRTAAARSALVG